MHITLHIASYCIPLLLIGLVPSLVPTIVQGVPLAISSLFNLIVIHCDPTPNEDQLFMVFHLLAWILSGCWLGMLCELFISFLSNITLITDFIQHITLLSQQLKYPPHLLP